MAFFPRTIYNTEASIAPLFRLFEEIDNQSRQSARQSRCQQQRQCAPRRATAPAPRWQPRFDVRETAHAYHLYGELPGLSKEDISIEFPEHQQVVVRGKTERNYASAAPAPATPAPVAPAETAAPAEPAPEKEDDASSRHSYQATVEDESDDEDNFEVIEGTEESHQTKEKADEHEDEDETMSEPDPEEQLIEEQLTQPEPTPAPVEPSRYWLKERSIGQFARGFSFPERIEQDEVTASLENGILTVTVPKSKPHQPRHVTVN